MARATDIGYVTPHDTDDARAIVAEIRAEQQTAGRADEPLHIFGDLVVFLDDDQATAEARRERLDTLAGEPYTSDARIFAGTAAQLADLLQELQTAGLSAASGCGPPSPGTTSRRSPRSWSPNSSAGAPSARPTRPTPCADYSGSPAPPTATPLPRPPPEPEDRTT